MGEFILKYWVQEIMIILTGAIGWMFKRVYGWKKEQELVKQGMLALLHDRLYQAMHGLAVWARGKEGIEWNFCRSI